MLVAKRAKYFTNDSPAQEFYSNAMRKALESEGTTNPATAIKAPLMRALVDAAAKKHQEQAEAAQAAAVQPAQPAQGA